MNSSLVHELSPDIEPVAVFERLEGLRYRIFFDSACAAGKYARFSFIAADPVVVVRSKAGSCEIIRKSGMEYETVFAGPGNPLDHLRRILAEFEFTRVAGLPPFQGGAAGFVGYEFGGQLERLPQGPPDDLQLPDLCVGIYDCVFAWDHEKGRAWIISSHTGLAPQGSSRVDFFMDIIRTVKVPDASKRPSRNQIQAATPASSLSRTQYRAGVVRIREYIAAGDIFQANFAQRFTAPLSTHPWQLYRNLRMANPAPFACYFEAGELTLASVSPERFLKTEVSGAVETRPIKGTAKRTADAGVDAEAGRMLLASEKDNAEHVMIVDVLRNDLSRVCKPASVRVIELAVLETHPTVHHLVSTIRGELEENRDPIDLLKATFPGGSITGAPKVRAMEVIAELEPVRRDVYCGCMLYITPDGAMDSSIVIRTFIATRGNVFFSAGGGIVADSDPELEYEETLHKAAALFSVLQVAE